jgi:thiosulfate/3-mercaptopyruvate sulfurtransferase
MPEMPDLKDERKHLVSTRWLADRLDAPDIVVVDASYYLPDAGRDGQAEYEEQRIPGAVFFDIDDIADSDSPLPHMMPSAEKFSSRVRKLGIGDGTRVVVYDGAGLFSAARVWWMLRTFGHEDVAILDGGLPKWQADGLPIDRSPPEPRQPRHFTARFSGSNVRDKADVLRAIESGSAQLADARSPGRFKAEEPEPREGMRGGHMPGATNVHYRTLLNDDGTVKATQDIRAVFEAAGLDLGKPVITTCGSGVTAAILTLGLTLLGHNRNALYDGSWSEWGLDSDTPVETG